MHEPKLIAEREEGRDPRFDEIWRRHYGSVLGFARRRTADDQTAQVLRATQADHQRLI